MLANKKRAVLSLIFIFLCGFALGILADRTVLPQKKHKHRKSPEEYLFKKLTEEIVLDKTQQDQLKMMLDEFKVHIDSMREDHGKDYWDARKAFDQEFRQILSEEQKTEFDRFLKEAKERFEKRKKHKEAQEKKLD